jgi:hypothetical protein
MRTLAAALLVLALPSAALAQFSSQPLPQTRYRPPPINGGAPAGAAHREIVQPRDGYRTLAIDGRVNPGAVSFGRELDRVRRDIDRRRDSGELSRSEARALRREASRIDAMAERYRRDGFTEYERRELELRASELRNRTATGRSL